jgi:hypothetical protein
LAGSFEHSDETSDFVKGGELLEQLSNLKKLEREEQQREFSRLNLIGH